MGKKKWYENKSKETKIHDIYKQILLNLMTKDKLKSDSPRLNVTLQPRHSPRTQSPLVSPASSPSSPLSSSQPSVSYFEKSPTKPENPSQTKAKKSKALCPCGASSLGQSWIITCPECKQTWHNACAGLKAEFPKTTLNSSMHF